MSPGIQTKIEEVPFIVSIQSKIIKDSCNGSAIKCETWQHVCTGIIVSERHVITGAPCFFQTCELNIKTFCLKNNC